MTANRHQRACFAITERRWFWRATHSPGQSLANIPPLLFGDRRETGQRLAISPSDKGGIADNQYFGVARDREVGRNPDPTAL